jgi:pSer/pThr/pTyr-binding forkhead associated (FHA) protein
LEAWVKVEAGFRPGRDLVISRDRTTIGRGEGSDIALFGDNGVEKQHAVILQEKGGYFLEALPNTPGTYINEIPVTARAQLRTGDQIRVGKSLLRFNQRRKK